MACNEAFSRARPLRDDAAGFTLIELVAVIVILGVLAAVAVPGIFDARDDAWNQTLKSNAAALRTGVDSARLAWRIRGGGVAVTDLSGWHDGTADFNANGWVIGTTHTGGGLTASHCAEIWRAALLHGPSVTPWEGVMTPGFQYGARYIGGLGCAYVPLTAAGDQVRNIAQNNIIYILYDPFGELNNGTTGFIYSADRSSTWTFFDPPP